MRERTNLEPTNALGRSTNELPQSSLPGTQVGVGQVNQVMTILFNIIKMNQAHKNGKNLICAPLTPVNQQAEQIQQWQTEEQSYLAQSVRG